MTRRTVNHRSPVSHHNPVPSTSVTSTRLVAAAVLSFALLAGCGVGGDGADGATQGGSTVDAAQVDAHTPLSEAVDVDALDEHRTDHVGDNSAVIALVRATRPEAVGGVDLQLHTDAEPYALTLSFSATGTPLPDAETEDLLSDRAALLLATIGNVDEVRWEVDGRQQGSMDRAAADERAGSPVSELGATREGLEELVGLLG